MKNADRIVGGKDAPSEIPWQVSIRLGMDNSLGWPGGMHWCGGTILDSKTILSAAHCFFGTAHFGNTGKQLVNQLKPFIKVGLRHKGDSNAQVCTIMHLIWLYP